VNSLATLEQNKEVTLKKLNQYNAGFMEFDFFSAFGWLRGR